MAGWKLCRDSGLERARHTIDLCVNRDLYRITEHALCVCVATSDEHDQRVA